MCCIEEGGIEDFAITENPCPLGNRLLASVM